MRISAIACAVAAAVVLGNTTSASPIDVMILGDGNSEGEVVPALEGVGLDVVVAGRYDKWDGITPDVDDFDVVVLLNGYFHGVPMVPRAEYALANFVANGGGLVVTEWASYDAYIGVLGPAVADLLPVFLPDGLLLTEAKWNLCMPLHPMARDLPEAWPDKASLCIVEPHEKGVVVVDSDEGIPLMTYRIDSGGIVVHINHDLTDTTKWINRTTMKAIVNATLYASRGPGEFVPGERADVVQDGQAQDDRLGHRVAAVGDVNGDGHDDYAASAYTKTVGGMLQCGRVYVYSGIDHTLLWSAKGQHAKDRFGFSLAGVGDVNGDLYPDILVGARFFDHGQEENNGKIYMLSGVDGSVIWAMPGGASNDQLGTALDALARMGSDGDLNGDGYPDVIVGALGKLDETGRVYLLSGADGTIIEAMTGMEPGDRYGFNVAGLGDIDLDGWPDFAIGSYREDISGPDCGRVRVYSGAKCVEMFDACGEASGDEFGTAIAAIGSIDGDRIPDILVGARLNDGDTEDPDDNRGRAYVFSGVDGTLIHTLTGESPGARFGYCVTGLGGVVGEPGGLTRFAISAERFLDIGRVYVFGWTDPTPLKIITGEHVGDLYGNAMAVAGDINCGGTPDVIVGAKFHSSEYLAGGRIYIYFSEDIPNVFGGAGPCFED